MGDLPKCRNAQVLMYKGGWNLSLYLYSSIISIWVTGSMLVDRVLIKAQLYTDGVGDTIRIYWSIISKLIFHNYNKLRLQAKFYLYTVYLGLYI